MHIEPNDRLTILSVDSFMTPSLNDRRPKRLNRSYTATRSIFSPTLELSDSEEDHQYNRVRWTG